MSQSRSNQEYYALIIDARSKLKAFFPNSDPTIDKLYLEGMLKLIDTHIGEFKPEFTVDEHGCKIYNDSVFNDVYASVSAVYRHALNKARGDEYDNIVEQILNLYDVAASEIAQIKDVARVFTLTEALNNICDPNKIQHEPLCDGPITTDTVLYELNFKMRKESLLKKCEELRTFIQEIGVQVRAQNDMEKIQDAEDEKRFKSLHQQVDELRDTVRSLLSQLKEDIFDVNMRKLVNEYTIKVEFDNSGFYHYDLFDRSVIRPVERIQIFKGIEGEIDEWKILIRALERQLANQREMEDKFAKQETMIKDLQEEIKFLKAVNLAEKTLAQNTEKMLSEITNLTRQNEGLAGVVSMTANSNMALAKVLNALDQKVEKKFAVVHSNEKYYQECIDHFESIIVKGPETEA